MKNKVEHRKISEFTTDPRNANLGSERGLRVLDDSIAETGLGRSIVADKNGVIIGGNKTTERSIDRGFDDAIVVHTEGKQLVIVQRDDLDLSDTSPNNPARKLAYYDNVASMHLTWDANVIAADVEAGVLPTGIFMEYELNNILERNQEEIDRAAMWQGMPEFKHEDLTACQSIHIHFKTVDDVRAFAELIKQPLTDKTRSIWYPQAEIIRYGKAHES